MLVHHIIQEADQKNACPYCNEKPAKWISIFDCNNHYKEFDCKCGHKVRIKMEFIGSGEDSWSQDLDERVEEGESKSQKG